MRVRSITWREIWWSLWSRISKGRLLWELHRLSISWGIIRELFENDVGLYILPCFEVRKGVFWGFGWIVSAKHFIYILYLKLTMHTSFQSTGYKHSLQTQILGPSNLKILNGEDLSTFHFIQRVEIESDCSNCNQTCGGVNSKNSVWDARRWIDKRRSSSISRRYR